MKALIIKILPVYGSLKSDPNFQGWIWKTEEGIWLYEKAERNCGRHSLKAGPANKELQPVQGVIIKARTRNCGTQRRDALQEERGQRHVEAARVKPMGKRVSMEGLVAQQGQEARQRCLVH
ncbi:Disco-Interacting Protein 2-like C [Manis pentadactyla]|nr:Disco-Interacting Protein 2-like C [Manis pentadactyla]